MNDQRFGGWMKLGSFLDGKRKGFCHCSAIVILGRRMAHVIEELYRRSLEPLTVVGKRNVEPLAIGRCLLVCERQTAERFRQILGSGAINRATGAGDKVIGADLLGPNAD